MKAKIILLPLAILLLFSHALGNELTITFAPSNTITVAEGATTRDTVTFNINNVNLAPIAFYIDTTGFTSATCDTVRSGSDRLTRFIFTIAPDYSDAGTLYGIDLIGYDDTGADTMVTLQINVTGSGRPPDIINLPDTIAINEGDSIGFLVAAYDLDDDIYRYRISPSSRTWVKLDSTSGEMAIGPVPYSIATWRNNDTTLTFSITVIDSTNLSDMQPLSIKVMNVDRPPYFTNPSRDTMMTVYQNAASSLHFRASDPDGPEGDTARFFDSDSLRSFLQGRGWTVTFVDSVLNFTPPGNAQGLASQLGFRIVAARGTGAPSDTVVINFNVLDTIPPGEITSFTGDYAFMPFGVIRFGFTAPHEDGASGGAVSRYLIRFAMISPGGDREAWWNLAQEFSEQPPVPQSPGTHQTFDAIGRTEYQNYWYGIRSVDSSGNQSTIAISNQIHSRFVPPAIYLLGDLPDTVRADSLLHFTGVAADSGGILQSVRYQAGTGSWSSVSIDSTRDSSSVFIRKYFHFTQSAGAGGNLTVQVCARDFQDSTIISHIVYVDNTPPSMQVLQRSPSDSATNNNNFIFSGSKDRDAVVYRILSLGENPGTPLMVTTPGDNRSTWSYSEVVYYQGSVTFKFFCLDNAGNISDTTRFNYWLVLSQEPPNIINPDSVDYHNSTVFNPQRDSFYISFPFPSTAQFNLSVVDRMGTVVYSLTDSLIPSPNRYTASWNGMMNSGPDAGQLAADGRYIARFSARSYPVSPYDIPIQTELILDSYAPYQVSFFPETGGTEGHLRIINATTVFSLVVGDSGAANADFRANIIPPYMLNGVEHVVFSPVDSTTGLWILNMASLPSISPGTIVMPLVISDAAGNENSYTKIFEVTADEGVTGFVNFPNPFAPSVEQTRITFVLGQAVSSLNLEIFDAAGDLVFRRALDASFMSPAAHEFVWDGKSLWGKKLNNGVYFARLTGGVKTDFLKIAIVDR